jgi:trehalose synthase
MVPLLRDVGVNAKWDVIKGDERFFAITKSIHNALHGVAAAIADDEFDYFVDTNRRNAAEMDLHADFVFVHDPQPVALVEQREKLGGHWLWRGHVDFSRPICAPGIFSHYVELYDAAVFSAPSFARELAINSC